MILVTPDGAWSTNTCLSLSSDLDEARVPNAVAGHAGVVFLEDYLFDRLKAGLRASGRRLRPWREAVARVEPMDTTGTGDQFDAGVFSGLVAGTPLAVAGRMGCIAESQVIGHHGARPIPALSLPPRS